VRENAVEAVWAVKNAGHEIVVITDRSFGKTPSVSENATLEWWDEYGFPEFDEIHFTPNKVIVPTDIFVEDKLENHDAIRATGTTCYLINRPWNEIVGGDHRARIDDISEYPAKVAFHSELRSLTRV